MSLGSKELFHSNFLEYLWNVNQRAFIDMINSLPSGKLNKKLDSNQSNNYILGREVENFDICIFHNDNQGKVYDLVLENKVKSIPYKEQLHDYENKAKKSKYCRFILLTLSKDFPDYSADKDSKSEEDSIINRWDVVGYDDLRSHIASNFKGDKVSKKDGQYITDYLDFIKLLSELKDYIIPSNVKLLNQVLFNQDIIDALRTIRLHDLYIKLRCSWFAMELKRRLDCNTRVVHKFGDIDIYNDAVNINVDINQGNGQIAAWICNRDTDSTLNETEKKTLKNTFEIVIQGNQYRHGISLSRIRLPNKTNVIKDKYDRLNELYLHLQGLKDQRAFYFLNHIEIGNGSGPYITLPDRENAKFRSGEKKNKEKKGLFNCYSDGYLYRYIEISDQYRINDLIGQMINDINAVLSSSPRLVDSK